jgi:hypothetical protein
MWILSNITFEWNACFLNVNWVLICCNSNKCREEIHYFPKRSKYITFHKLSKYITFKNTLHTFFFLKENLISFKKRIEPRLYIARAKRSKLTKSIIQLGVSSNHTLSEKLLEASFASLCCHI